MTQEVLNTYAQLFNKPALLRPGRPRSAQFPIEGYDELTVEKISGRLNGLSVEDLRVVRDHEERNKNRDKILGQLDRGKRQGSQEASRLNSLTAGKEKAWA
jgi:hypothetical protein